MKTLRNARLGSLAAAAALVVCAPAVQAETSIARVDVSHGVIAVSPLVEAAGVSVSVSAPGGVVLSRSFGWQESAVLELVDAEGNFLGDGQYNYEVRLTAPSAGTRDGGGAEGGKSGAGLVQSGAFRVVGGAIVAGGSDETSTSGVEAGPVLEAGGLTSSAPVPLDYVIADDLIVQFSACIGNDCVNGESFGFDTLRLKENNTRIKFQDTSNSASFPSNDWQLTANDSSNGGLNKFSIDDIDNGRTPFTIEASAPSHSLYVDDGGRVGLGTSTPVVELHVKDGDSPTLRLEQDGSSGFTPQTWDVAGNETNFFIRDVTNGSKLPVRIRPGAGSNSLLIDGSGNLMSKPGTTSNTAGASLHVYRNDGTAKVLVQEASGTTATRVLADLENNGPVIVQMENTARGENWQFGENSSGAFFVRETSGATADEFTLTGSGNMTILGTLTENSDRNRKDNIVAVEPMDVLKKVTEVPISTWTYKEDASVTHLGPMAQDFHAAFGLGANDTSIATVDTSGVALASIQALSRLAEEKDAQIKQLEERLAALEALIAER